MANSGIWFKLTHMKKDMLLKKLLSFDNVYVVAVRPFAGENALPRISDDAFQVITGTKGVWYADPSLFERNGETWLFMEAYDRRELLGRIACCRLGTSAVEPRIVIKEDFHMSFPQVFSWNDGIYMLPETGDDRSLRLYRARKFPDDWELITRIPTKEIFVDTVVVKKEPRKLTLLSSELSTERQYYQRYHKMYLILRDNGEWTLNDDEPFLARQEFSYCARNAGSIYEEDGQRILPMQESTETVYGVRMNFVRYQEQESDLFASPVGTVGPEDVMIRDYGRGRAAGGRLDGVHSYARAGGYEAIDLFYTEFAPLKYYRRLIKRLKG